MNQQAQEVLKDIGLSTYVTAKQKIAHRAIYLSLGTFKKIALLTALTLLLVPNLGYASVIELVPHVPDPNELAYMNLSISFANHTKALMSNQSLDEARANEAVTILNALIEGTSLRELMENAMQGLEPLEEEELQEEQEEESESSSSSESSDDDSGPGLIPQPGDDQTFPEDAEPQPFPEPQPEPNNGSEDNNNSGDSDTDTDSGEGSEE